MRYVLGIHLGATRATAAVSRYQGGPWGPPEVVTLSGGAPWVDSVLYVSREGDLLVGQAALHRAPAEPERIARSPLHRTGDPVPFVLGEASYPAESLAAGLIGWVADRVAEVEGSQPERIVVTHPPSWSAFRRGLLHDALDQAQLPGVLALPSPIAAAESCLWNQDIEPGKALAVCAIGGEHVETAVLRRGPRGFELLGHAEGGEQEAGSRLDDLLVRHVLQRVAVDQNDPGAMARLRAACVAAKERLSQVPEVIVTDEVYLTREEFEEFAKPVLSAALSRLERLVSTVPSEQLVCAALVGGTARIPLARRLAETMLSCPVAVDDDPGTALCRGAALAAQPRQEPAPAQAETSGTLVTSSYELPAVFGQADEEFEPPPERPPVEITPLEPPKRRFSLARKGGSSTTERDEDR